MTLDLEILKGRMDTYATMIHNLEERIKALEEKYNTLAENCQNDFDKWGEVNVDKLELLQKKLFY